MGPSSDVHPIPRWGFRATPIAAFGRRCPAAAFTLGVVGARQPPTFDPRNRETARANSTGRVAASTLASHFCLSAQASWGQDEHSVSPGTRQTSHFVLVSAKAAKAQRFGTSSVRRPDAAFAGFDGLRQRPPRR
jgi:hypothetical protein